MRVCVCVCINERYGGVSNPPFGPWNKHSIISPPSTSLHIQRPAAGHGRLETTDGTAGLRGGPGYGGRAGGAGGDGHQDQVRTRHPLAAPSIIHWQPTTPR